MGGPPKFAGSPLTLREYDVFGAIGAVVCDVGGRRTTASAFLVGRFDLAVTVAHVFRVDGHWVQPDACFFANADPGGRIRERIGVDVIQTQWESEPLTFGRPSADLAVLRLRKAVDLASRTLSLTAFARGSAPALLVGHRVDVGVDAIKRKTSGRVFRSPASSCVRFTHDIDARNIAAGAPIIDTRDNVVIGIHTRLRRSRDGKCPVNANAMIVMSEWLVRTLRSEISKHDPQHPD